MAMNELEKKKYEEIKELIISCCDEVLNVEYKELSVKALDKLSRKRNIPFMSGKLNTWACGIIYAIGQANFLFDKSSKPYIAAMDLASYFGVAKSTAGSKACEISKMLKIDFYNSEWIIPSNMEDNSMIWILQVNGLMMDIRNFPVEMQIQAYNKGLIPYVPSLKAQGIDIFKK